MYTEARVSLRCDMEGPSVKSKRADSTALHGHTPSDAIFRPTIPSYLSTTTSPTQGKSVKRRFMEIEMPFISVLSAFLWLLVAVNVVLALLQPAMSDRLFNRNADV